MNQEEAASIAAKLCTMTPEEAESFVEMGMYSGQDMLAMLLHAKTLIAAMGPNGTPLLPARGQRLEEQAENAVRQLERSRAVEYELRQQLIEVHRLNDKLDLPNPEIEQFKLAVHKEIIRARGKHPMCTLTAVAEELGEVARALQDESVERVYEECVQLACTAARIAIEGDPTADDHRVHSGLEPTSKE